MIQTLTWQLTRALALAVSNANSTRLLLVAGAPPAACASSSGGELLLISAEVQVWYDDELLSSIYNR